MLRQAKEFKNFKLRATDGDIGKTMEFYFDDKHWTVRYLVADTGGWLFGRQVLISPYALSPANETERVFPVNLTKKKIEESPSLGNDKPISHQFETAYYSYYGWPAYWNGYFPWGNSPYIIREPEEWKNQATHEKAWDHNLRSTNAVTGYHIQASDGAVGHVADFIIDEETWSIRYLVVATKNWWPGKHVLVSPQWIKQVNWDDSKVFINLSGEKIMKSPLYTQESLNRDYETKLRNHYNHEGYWTQEPETRK